MTAYRPWGHLDWALSLTAPQKWSFLGCLGLEQRSVAAIIELKKLDLLSSGHDLLLRINDIEIQDHAHETGLYQQRIDQCLAAGITPKQEFHCILDPSAEWLGDFDKIKSKNVILDISSMPKRFFFPLLRRILLDQEVQNFMICYTSPKSYCSGPLSGNPEDWDVIPGFRTDDPDTQTEANKRLIVNVGFMPEGLIEHLEEGDPSAVAHLIFPFPAQSTSVRRSWAAVQRLVGTPSHFVHHKIHRVCPQDMSEAYERLINVSARNQVPVALAPFGPKPISAAMCIYAAKTGMPVYYSQPKAYSSSYSTGISQVYGYWVKQGGQNLYQI